MIPLWLLILLIVILFAATIGSYMANKRQQIKAQIQAQTHKLRLLADEYQELAAELANLSPMTDAAVSINQHANNIYQRILSIDAENQLAQTALEQSQSFEESLKSQRQVPKTVFSNEAALKSARNQLNKAGRLFMQMRERSEIPRDVFDTYHHELSWLYIQCEIDSLIYQGDTFLDRDAKLKAIAFYQKAKNNLKKSMIDDPRRQERLDLLDEKITAAEESNKPS